MFAVLIHLPALNIILCLKPMIELHQIYIFMVIWETNTVHKRFKMIYFTWTIFQSGFQYKKNVSFSRRNFLEFAESRICFFLLAVVVAAESTFGPAKPPLCPRSRFGPEDRSSRHLVEKSKKKTFFISTKCVFSTRSHWAILNLL
jgi:hypothetical protein